MNGCGRSGWSASRAVALSLMLIAAQTAYAQAEPAKPASTPPAPKAIDVDPVADPGGAWTRFLASADIQTSFAAYSVLNDLPYTHVAVDADGCATHREALSASVRTVPISIALHRAAMLCAEALGDEAAAERELAAVAALSKHALADRGNLYVGRPIRVFQLWDIYALLNSLGYEFRYEYFEDLRPKRYFKHIVAAWDPEKKTERHLVFDYIDTVVAVDRDNPLAGYPYHRNATATAFVDGLLKENETIAHDLEAIRKASSEPDLRERVKWLRAGVERGGIQSAMTWLHFCAETDVPDCADGLVDALLPQAEKGDAFPMIVLAGAYAHGIGLPKDRGAAEKMIAAADARWQPRAASVAYVRMMRQIEGHRLSKQQERLLRAAVAAGNPEAELLLTTFRILQDADRPLGKDEIEMLQRPSNNTMGLGWTMLGGYYEKTGQQEAFREAMRKAADAGMPAAQYFYAKYLRETATSAQSLAEARAMMIRAAQGDDADAMRDLAASSVDEGDWAAAAGWLQAAVVADDIDAIFDLAMLVEEQTRPGVNGTPENVFELYQRIANTEHGARARRGMARMALRGVGTSKNPAKAQAWLSVDAENGDVESQLFLGTSLLTGEFGVPDIAAGESWLKKAIAAGSEEAKIAYGSWLIKRAPSVASHAEGRKLLAEAEAAGDGFARNNLAWAFCVSPYDDVRDPKSGLVMAKRIEAKLDDLDAGTIDTIAACYAANGDFARAVELQKRAMADWPKDEDGRPKDNPGMAERLALYNAGKPYIEALPSGGGE